MCRNLVKYCICLEILFVRALKLSQPSFCRIITSNDGQWSVHRTNSWQGKARRLVVGLAIIWSKIASPRLVF